VLASDRTHTLNVSWNALLPDGAKGSMDNAFGKGLLNGWQLSGIRRSRAGIPIRPSFTGAAAGGAVSATYFGTADIVGPSNTSGNALVPVFTCDPRLDGSKVGEKILDINCIKVPTTARTATWCRSTTSGRPRGRTTT
jgi:hypothetical protein